MAPSCPNAFQSSGWLQFRRERQQRDILRALDRHGQPALVPRASSGHAARKNLAALLDERRQNLGPLVIDVVRLVHAEPANLLLADETSLALLAGPPGRPPRPAARRTDGTAGPEGALGGTMVPAGLLAAVVRCSSAIRFLPC